MIRITGLSLLLTFYSQLVLADWSLTGNYDDNSVYKSENDTRLVASYNSVQFESKKITKNLIETLAKEKEKMLGMMGITAWQVDKTNLEKRGDVTHVRLDGSYVDSSQEKVFFIEYHYYSDTKKLQLLLTNGEKSSLDKDAVYSNLKKIRGQYDI